MCETCNCVEMWEDKAKNADASESELSELLAKQAPELGDYCIASRWSDEDKNDPFEVGFLAAIMVKKKGTYYALEGDNVTGRWFPNCRKITSEEGKKILAG